MDQFRHLGFTRLPLKEADTNLCMLAGGNGCQGRKGLRRELRHQSDNYDDDGDDDDADGAGGGGDDDGNQDDT